MSQVHERHEAGLQLERLIEYPFLEWKTDFLVEAAPGRYVLPPDTRGELPLMFSLRARKPRGGTTTA
jgi:hypothetical protein